MRTLRLIVSYDGADFCGWQVQPNAPTVQQALADAFCRLAGGTPPADVGFLVGSSRTDSGVHALGQVVRVETANTLPPHRLRLALNALLPPTVAVREVAECPPEFDPIRDARWKLYRYVFHDGPVPDVFARGRCWQQRRRLDDARMDDAAQRLQGTHDFRAFETSWPTRKTSVRTMRRCRVTRLGDFVTLDCEANGFLYNMVRAIAGTLREVGQGRRPPEAVLSLVGPDAARPDAGATAPPEGLFLVRVEY